MTQYLHIEIISTGAVLKLTYRRGKFIKLELTGKLTDIQLKSIGKIIPPKWEDVKQFREEFPEHCHYTPVVKEKSIYQQYVDAWYNFYEKYKGIPPRFNATEGLHLKQIIRHLEKIEGTEEKALALWKGVLSTWEDLDKFHQNNTDLKYINSRLNVILDNVKRATNNYKNDFR